MPSPSRPAALVQLLQGRLPEVARLPTSGPHLTTCLRLCAGRVDGVEGLIVDRFGSLVVATDYAEPGPDAFRPRELLDILERFFPDCHRVVKVRAAADGANAFVGESSAPAGLPAEPLVAHERGLAFEIGRDPAHDFGLYLDAAKARAAVRELASGLRVLNLFSYAGGFGIAAAAGGASEVTNVDPNRDYLAWSLRNAALNGLAMRVLPDTAQDFLAKHLRRLARNPQTPGFELVIVDPPAFGVGRGNQRLVRLLWPEIFAALRVMKPRHLVLLCNDKYFRARKGFAELVQAELGTLYAFDRLGTHFSIEECDRIGGSTQGPPPLVDPLFVEPVVLLGTAR